MTDQEFNRIYNLLKKRYGIDLERKKEIVSGRLENYVKMGGWSTYSDYLHDVEQDFSGKLEEEMVNILTTNHTYFMREFEHFDFLKQEVLPWLRKKEANKKDLSIWCGAASTGEEPYMIAMLLIDFFGLEHNQWDTKVLATDLSTEALKKAVAGVYTREQIAQLPDTWKRRFTHLSEDGQKVEIVQSVKDEVIFRQFNLMDPFPFRRRMHIVFLRNVMIYFDAPTKKQLIKKVYDAMEPGGYLFIGRTETIDRRDVPFELVQPSIFRKQEGSSRNYASY